MPIVLFILALLFLPVNVTAQTDLSMLFPAGEELVGWTLVEEPKPYRGDELFLMIDGGADIYHEYGFSQVLAAEYENREGKSIRLEIYEMESPEAAYGIYSFKIGPKGKALGIGQAALLEEYYLNVWKGNLLVTVVGSDTDKKTIEAVITIGKYVDNHYLQQSEQPELAELLMNEPFAFSRPKYVRGSIGVMNSYIFDTEDVFQVREGMIGTIEDEQVFVFRYAEEQESIEIFNSVTTRFATNDRFSDVSRKDNIYTMVDKDRNFVFVRRTGQDIIIVIGHNPKKTAALAEQLVKKLNGV